MRGGAHLLEDDLHVKGLIKSRRWRASFRQMTEVLPLLYVHGRSSGGFGDITPAQSGESNRNRGRLK
jgi:hypothetical protein